MRTSTRCNRDVPRGRTRWARGIKLFLMFFLLGSFLIPAKIYGQNVVVDGNARTFSNEWSRSFISHVADKYNLVNQDTIFQGNSKDFQHAGNTITPFWEWTLGTAKDKNDIANGAAFLTNAVDTGAAGNTVTIGAPFIVFAGDRISNSGDAQIGFWFFQDGTAPVTGGYFSPDKHAPPTRGDILVLADFRNGGRNASITVLEWVGSGGNFADNPAFDVLPTNLAAVAENNGGTSLVPSGWAFTDKNNNDPLTNTTTYSRNEFYEGYVALGTLFGNVPICFSRFMIETRSTHEITSTLDDFVGGPLGGAPQPLVLTGSSVCAGTTGTITSATSVSGFNYQLKDAANADVQAAKPGTGSGLTWTGVAIGNGYYVVTINPSTQCTATSNTVNVSSIPNPAPTAHNLSSCETGSTGGATFDLNTAINSADGGTISFYTSLANAQAGTSPIATPGSYPASIGTVTIYVRSANGSCYGTTSFTVTVTDNPDVVVQNLSGCESGTSGSATFDLNSGVTNTDGGSVSFFATQANAQANTSPIASPTTYSAPIGTTTIWVRDANGTCATITSFTITVTDNPDVVVQNLSGCESGTSGSATFDLNSGVTNADGGSVSFFATQANAQANTSPIASPTTYSAPIGTTTIWVRDANGTCATITSFTITVTDNPDVVVQNLSGCESGTSGSATFDLNSGVTNADGGSVSFFATQANAQANTSPIASPTTYSAPIGTTTIWVRDANGTCATITSFTITVTDNPDVVVQNLSSCETGTTEHATFNLNNGVTNADGGSVSFFATQANAQANTSPIASPTTYSAPIGTTTIWVRDANGTCATITSFTITVTDNPDVVVTNLTACETGTTGSATVNLNNGVTNADGGSVSFFTSQANAQANTSPIASPTTYSAPVGVTTIWVRDANGTCVTITSFTVTVTSNATANAGTATPQCRNSVAGTNTFGTNTFNLSGSGSGGTPTWTVFANASGYTVNIINGNTYTPTVELSGAAVNGGSVTMRLTVSGGTCGTATSDVVLTLTALPLIYTVTGTDFCPTAPSTGTITLSGSEVGVNYQLKKDGVNEGAPVAGTGNPIVWTGLGAGNYTVVGTRVGTSCTTTSGPDDVAENSAPDPSVRNLTSCENGTTGGASFNLNDAVTAADGGTITFYASLADAQAATNAVSASQTVTLAASPKTFWVRSQNPTTGCYGIRSFTVSVTDNPDVTVQNLTSCETGTTGHATFNLNNGVTALDGGTATFYASQADANAATNAIASPTTYSAPIGVTTIWVRDANGTCATVTSFTITVTDNPDVTVQNLTSCETGTTGHATFNLNNGVTALDGGTATFYASQADANAATNAIASPTTYSAPIGVTTIWVRDANGTCATVTSFTITVHANPTPTADNKEVCVGATVDLTGSPVGGTWSGDHVTGSTFDATGVAAGNYTVTYTVTDEFGCVGSATATVTVKACGGPLCTYTQGYYGNTNGNSCDADGNGGDPVTYQNPTSLITAQLLNGGTLTVGISGRSVVMPVPDAAITAAKINSVMPGGGTAKELTVGSDVNINTSTFDNNYLTKQGRINNVLLSQTITLGLNMRISSGLPDFALQAGEFATATPDGPCGTKTTKPQCTYSTVYPYGLIGSDTYTYKTITADVITALGNKGYALTVSGLFMLANDALGNADGIVGTEGGASLSAINAAVSAINEGFDKCRVFVGWNVAHCSLTDPNALTSSGASRTSNTGLASVSQTDKLSVSAYPNPFNDVVKFSIQSKVAGNAQLTIYNMLGQRINTIYNGYVPANKNILVEYKAQKTAQQNLIYILTINGEKVTGKVLNINN